MSLLRSIVDCKCITHVPALRSLFLPAAVFHLAIAAVAYAGGERDDLAIRSGRAVLRSASPREAGRIPVVLVHGLFGSPGNWSVMIDRLTADPPVRERFQLLTFGYDSLQPISESASQLLETLAEARRRFDADGRDDSFDRIVLVGHSLGGLIAKEAAAHASGSLETDATCPPPVGQELLARPRVGRVIYVATPHRGSPIDRGVVKAIGTWLARDCRTSTHGRQKGGDEVPPSRATSVEQLAWDHPYLRDLDRSGAAAGLLAHSIIASLSEPSAVGATDGLVPVSSARLEGARSEVVVRTSHLCFQDPEVIQEVQRVLVEHAAEPLSQREPERSSGHLPVATLPPPPADPSHSPTAPAAAHPRLADE
jgi:pimeloyl-ACP methyl ester carboxylesterase